MNYLALPTGVGYGWGVCGKYIAQEMARLAPTRLLTGPFTAESVGDEMDHYALSALLPSQEELDRIKRAAAQGALDGPLLMAVKNARMHPHLNGLCGRRTVGYTFFEEKVLSSEALENGRRYYDHIAAGSTDCERRLREAGLTSVSTVIQGVDPTLFEPSPVERRYFHDRFVVFSGGKLELRKGQDVVVRAFKVLQDKYADVVLVTAWNNPWPNTLQSISLSRLVRFAPSTTEQPACFAEFLAQNGVDPRRTVNLRALPNPTLARVYKQTDIGLFPNRCEGGTNLVLMEYMACGKPVIASFSSGHRDILTDENSLPLTDLRPVPVERDGQVVALWDEPNLDEVVARLEFAYANRERLTPIAQQAGQDMRRYTWRHTAEQFLRLLQGPAV